MGGATYLVSTGAGFLPSTEGATGEQRKFVNVLIDLSLKIRPNNPLVATLEKKNTPENQRICPLKRDHFNRKYI